MRLFSAKTNFLRAWIVALLLLGCGGKTGLEVATEEEPTRMDAGAPALDAGSPRRDAGAPPQDAGFDAGPEDGGGCGVELCTNLLDDDCDGLADCEDPDCGCAVVRETTFTMGSPFREPGREVDEFPHEVELTRPFAIDTTELTRARWRALMGSAPPSRWASCETCPVGQVNWFEALELANAASREAALPECYALDGCTGEIGVGCIDGFCALHLEGQYHCGSVLFRGLDCPGFRLPTEAEWELAARAGTLTAYSNGDDVSRLPEVAWYRESARARIHEVGGLEPNPWGIYDMHGNVYEWVWDTYGPYGSDAVVDPITEPPGDEEMSVIRGGSYALGSRYCRSANRGARGPHYRDDGIGIRLARTLPE